jgi:cell division protein ZapE
MLLGRVLEAVWAMGTTLMATSNRAPDELYKNGINRQLFLPTIAALKDKTHVISLTGEEDHRRTGGLGQGYMDESRDSQARARFEAAWDEMCSADHEQPADIAVAGRTLHVPRTRGTCARLDAGELIAQAFGPRDALAIADSFQTVFLEGLEPIPAAARDRAKRLTYLIDTLYEAGTTLVVLARGTPAELYGEGDYAFEFRRTASRLEEMTRTAAVHLRSNAA